VNRVVITGLGAVTPLGHDVRSYWSGLKAGENGVRPVGFAVVGTRQPKRSEYHYYAEPDSGSEDGQRQLLSEARRASRASGGQEPTRSRD